MIRLTALIAICILGASARSAPSDPSWLFTSAPERELVERAQRFSNRHDYREAMSLARQATSRFPESVEAHLTRVSIAEAMNELDSETAEYASAATREPGDLGIQLALAHCLYLSRNYSASYDQLKRAAALAPDCPQVLELEYRLAGRMPDPPVTARELYDRIIAKYPDFTAVLIHEADGLWGLPLEKPRLNRLINRLGNLPHPPPDYYVFLASRETSRRWHNPAQIVPFYNRAAAADTSRVDILLQRAEAIRRAGRIDDATAALRSAVSFAPHHRSARFALASLLDDQHRFDEAVQVLQDGIRAIGSLGNYEQTARRMQAQYLYNSGKLKEAAAIFAQLTKSNDVYGAARARNRLVQIYARRPGDHIRLLSNVPSVSQRGYYCGPASMSMVLGYFDKGLSQEAIAEEVFTGIAGTAPEILREFAARRGFESASFEGNVEKWKRLIDAGIPVLWLQMYGGWEGHYVVITGYDDIAKNLVVRDPSGGWEKRVGYAAIEDRWLLPSLRQSIAFAPQGHPALDGLAALRPTPRLVGFSRVMDVVTGANLFKHPLQAIIMNLAVAALLAIALMKCIGSCVAPHPRAFTWIVVGLVCLLVGALNFVIIQWRFGAAVAVLVALHISLLALVVVFAIAAVVRGYLHDWMTPREAGLVCAMVFGALVVVAVLSEEKWQQRIVLAIIAAGAGAVVIPRLRLYRTVRRVRYGPPCDAVALLQPLAFGANGFYAARTVLVEFCLRHGRYSDVIDLQSRIRKSRPSWSAKTLEFFDWVEGFAHLQGCSRATAELAGAKTARSPRKIFGRKIARSAHAWKTWPKLSGVPWLGFGPAPHYILTHAAEALHKTAKSPLEMESAPDQEPAAVRSLTNSASQ